MKLRLPHKFQAALMAALASVSFTTLSTGTLTVAASAALLAGQQAWADYTAHGQTFNVNTTGAASQNKGPTTNNLYVANGTAWGNATNFQGLYFAEGSGYQANVGNADLNVQYLYIDPSITGIAVATRCVVGELDWNGANANSSYNIKDAGWVDIDQNYGNRISLVNMTTSGDVYLNQHGALTLQNNGSAYTLNNAVHVHATSTGVDGDRTLLSGDFTNWQGTVTITGTDGTSTATWTSTGVTYAGAFNANNLTFSLTSAGLSYNATPFFLHYKAAEMTGPAFTWVDGHWVNSSGTQVNKPTRSNNLGPVMIVNNSGTVTNSAGTDDTSDGGGIKVTGNSDFTTSLGQWAGYIYVGEGSALSVSYNQKIKSLVGAGANEATVYVEGTLAITGRTNLAINDGAGDHNWYIGEKGFINLSAISQVSKSHNWNIQLSVEDVPEIDLSEYVNRQLGGSVTRQFMSTGADLRGSVDSWKVYMGDKELTEGTESIDNYTIGYANGGLNVTYGYGSTIEKMTLTWKGEDGAWAEKDSTMWLSGDVATSFVNGDDVVFSGAGNVARLGGAVKVDGMTITGDNTALELAGSGTVTANSVSFQDNATLTVSASADLHAGTLSVAENKTAGIAGAAGVTVDSLSLAAGAGFNVGEGSSATVGSVSGTPQLSVAAGGSLTITSTLNNFSGKVTGEGALHLNLNTNAEGDGDGRIMLADGSNIKDIYIDSGIFAINQNNATPTSNLRGANLHLNSQTFLVRNGAGAGTFGSGDTVLLSGNNTLRVYGGVNGNTVLATDFIQEGNNTATLQHTDGGTITMSGTIDLDQWKSAAGTTVFTGTVTLNHLYGGGGSTTLGDGNVTTTGQLRLSEQGEGNLTVDTGAVLNITGSENGQTTGASILLAHWGQSSTLTLNGGTIHAEQADVNLSWDGTGTFAANAGTAYVKGIDGLANGSNRRGTFSLGTADSGSATVVLGSTGLKDMGGSVVLNLGQGTLGASANWSLSTSGGGAVNANFIGTGTGTTIDTSTYTITFDNGTTGSGNVTVAGTGKLVLNGGGNRTGATTVQGGATLEVHNASALGTGAVTVDAGGTLDLQSAVTLGSLTLAAGADEADGGILKFCANDAPMTLSGNLTLGAGSVFDLDNIQYTSGDVTLATVDGQITGLADVKLRNDHGQHGASILSVSGNTLLLTFAQPDTLLVWSNDEGNGAWSEYSLNWRNTAGTPVAYTQSSSVRFTADVEDVAYVTAQNIKVDTLNIDSAATANIYTGSGKELSVASVEGAGATLSLTGEGSATVSGETVLDTLTVAGGSAAFNGTTTITALNAKGGEISFGSDATVGAVNVISGESTITGLGTITTLNATGGTATFSGTSSVTTLNVQGNGTSVLHGTGAITTLNATGGTTTLDAGTAVTTLNATSGTNTVNGAISVTTLNATGGTIAIHGTDAQNKASVGTVNVAQGATAEFTYTDFNFTSTDRAIKGNVTIGAGATGTVSGKSDGLNYDGTVTITVDGGTLVMNDRWTVGGNNQIVLNNGTVTGTGQSGASAFDPIGNNNFIVSTGTSSIAAPIRLRNAAVGIDVQSGTLTISGNMTEMGGAQGLVKNGAGTLALTGTLNYTGTTKVSAGTLTVGGAYSLNNANQLQVTGGTATFNGAVTIGANGTFSLADGAHLNFTNTVAVTRNELSYKETVPAREQGNGFGQTVTYVNMGAGLGGDASWTLNGTAATYDSATGDLSYANATTTYYIFNAVEDISTVMAQNPTKLVVDTLNDNEQALGAGQLALKDLVVESGVASSTHNSNQSSGNGMMNGGNITINAGGTFRISGHNDALGWGSQYVSTVTLNGENGNVATLDLAMTEGSETMKSNLILNGYTRVANTGVQKKGFNTYGGSITATGTDNIIDHMRLRDGVTVTVNPDATLRVKELVSDDAGNGGNRNFTKAGAGELTVDTCTATFNNLNVSGGSMTTTAGNFVINNEFNVTGEGTEVTFGGKVTMKRNARNNFEAAGSVVTFSGGLDFTGNGGTGYALIVKPNVTLKFGGTSTVRSEGGTLLAIGQEGGSAVELLDGATLTLGNLYNSSSLSNNGAVTLGNGATLNVAELRSASLTNAGTINATGDVTVDSVSGDGTITVATSNSFIYGAAANSGNLDSTYDGAISAGRLQKLGTGTLTLTGTNTFANATTLAGGTLAVTQVGALGGAGVTLSNGTSLVFNTTGDNTYGGALSGTGSVAKNGTGTLELTNISGYTGTITVNEGELLITTNGLPGTLTVTGAGELHMRSAQGTDSQNVDLKTVNATNLHLVADADHNSRFNYISNSNLTGVQNLYFDGGQLWLNGKDLTYAGAVTFNTTTYSEGNAFGGAAIRVNTNGTFSGAVNMAEDTKIAWGANKTVEFSGTVTGDGDLNLVGWNNNSTGTFKVSGTATDYTGAITSDSLITLNVANTGSLNLATGSNLAGAVAVDGTMSVSGDSAISGTVSGSGTINVNAGTLELTGASTFAGTTNVKQGTLVLGNAYTTNTITVASGATLSLLEANALTATGALTFESGARLDLSGFRGAVSTTPVTVATAGSISGFGDGMYTAPTAPKGMQATVTLGGVDNSEIQLSYSVKDDATMHLYVLTGQSNSLGAVKDSPLNATMLAAYQSEGLLWNGNMHKDRPSGADTNRFIENPDWQIVAPQEPIYNGNPCMGPEYGFSYIMENNGWASQLLGENDTLAVVKGSLDGGGNGYWLQDNNAYQTLLDNVKLSIKDAVDMGYTNISLDGLMYLQGESNSAEEANLAGKRFTDFVGYLKSDLESWLETAEGMGGVTLSFDDNTVTGEPRLGSDARQKTETQLLELATSEGMINADKNGKGHVLTNDLAVTNCDGQNVHYTGNSQLTIGARYAYAFAVQNGVNVGAVRGQDDSKTLDQAGAWWMEKLPGADEVATWDISSVSTVNNIADGQTLTVGGIKIDEVYHNGATAKGQGSIAINGGAISVGQHGINLVGGDLSITPGVTVRESQTWQAADGHKLAVNGTTTISDGATLTMKDGLYLTFGAINGTGNLEIGTVTFDMDLDYMLANGLGRYRTSTEEVAENGFFTGNLDLVRLTGTNSTITFTHEGGVENITKAGDLADYTLQLSGDGEALQITDLAPDADTYFTRKGEVTYTDTDTAQYGIYTAKQVMLSGSVDQPATLKLASALKEGVTIQASGLGGTVNIVDGVTLAATSVNAEGGTVALAGEGEYLGKTLGAVGSFSAADVLGSGVTLSDDWKGSVVLSGGNASFTGYTSMNALGDYHKADSTIVFNGLYAYFDNNYTVDADIEFRGTGADGTGTAFTMTAGNQKTVNFTGAITGKGNFVYDKNGGSAETFNFSGNIAEWTGSITTGNHNSGALNLIFSGAVTDVNAAITKGANHPISVTVDATNAVSFNKALTGLNSLTVNASKSASVLGGIGTNTTTLNAGASLTVGGTANSTLGTVTLNNDTALTIGGSGTVTASNVKVGDQCAATITLGNNFSMEQLDTIGANKTLSIASAEGEAKTLTTGQLGFDNVGTVISLQNVNMVVTGAATAGVLDHHSNNKGTMTVGANATLDLQGTTQWNTSDSEYVDLVVKDGGAVSVSGGTENKIRGVNLGAGSSLTFGAGTTTTIGGDVVLANTITNYGTLIIAHDITATGLVQESSKSYNVGVDDTETDSDNHFLDQRTEGTIRVVTGGGTLTPGGHKVTQANVAYTLNADGTATGVTADEVDYSVFQQYEAGSELNYSDIETTAALHGKENELVVWTAGATLNIDSAAAYAMLANATANIAQGLDFQGALGVMGGMNTITGQIDTARVSFATGANSETVFTDAPVQADGVRFTSDAGKGGVVVDAAKVSDEMQVTRYSVGDGRFDVQASELAKVDAGDVSVANNVTVERVHNSAASATGKLTLEAGVAAAALKEVVATSGDIEFLNMGDAVLRELEIGQGKAVSMYTGSVAEVAQEASVTVTGTLTAGAGATLNAGLNMASGSHLDVSGAQGSMGLIMGSPVTLNSGMYLDVAGYTQDQVSGYLYNYLSSGEHDLYYLYIGKADDPIELTINGVLQQADLDKRSWNDYDMDANTIYANLQAQTFYVRYDGSNVGMVAIGLIPEPTTSTLSLLALCALAARRRRK